MACNKNLYHYDGCCFNKGRVPDGRLAITEAECQAIDEKQEVRPQIIS